MESWHWSPSRDRNPESFQQGRLQRGNCHQVTRSSARPEVGPSRMTEPSTLMLRRDTGEAGSGEPTPQRPAPARPPALRVCRSLPALWHRDRCPDENAMPDGVRGSGGGGASAGSGCKHGCSSAPWPRAAWLPAAHRPGPGWGPCSDAPVGRLAALGCGPVLREFPGQGGGGQVHVVARGGLRGSEEVPGSSATRESPPNTEPLLG